MCVCVCVCVCVCIYIYIYIYIYITRLRRYNYGYIFFDSPSRSFVLCPFLLLWRCFSGRYWSALYSVCWRCGACRCCLLC